jgi:hypothetical protein
MPKKRPGDEIRLEIGGIVISLSDHKKNFEFSVPLSYKSFSSRKKPRLRLNLNHEARPDFLGKKKVFDAPSAWRLYRGDGEYIFDLTSLTAILDRNFKRGDIYLKLADNSFPLGYPLSELLTINLLAEAQGMVIHATAIKEKNEGILFAGVSGSGKSTLASFYQGQKKATILSDDRVIVRKQQGRFWVFGTPWHGEVKLYSPQKAVLKKIFFLSHGAENRVKKAKRIEASSRIVACSFPPFWSKKKMESTLSLVDSLTKEISCYSLDFVPDKSVLGVIRTLPT